MTDEEHDAALEFLRKRSPVSSRVYWELHKAAESGAACPPNRLLYEALGYSGHYGGMSAVLQTLVRYGMITMVTGKHYRQVTILHTGKATKPIPDGKERTARKAPAPRQNVDQSALRGTMSSQQWIRETRAIIDARRAEAGLPT